MGVIRCRTVTVARNRREASGSSPTYRTGPRQGGGYPRFLLKEKRTNTSRYRESRKEDFDSAGLLTKQALLFGPGKWSEIVTIATAPYTSGSTQRFNDLSSSLRKFVIAGQRPRLSSPGPTHREKPLQAVSGMLLLSCFGPREVSGEGCVYYQREVGEYSSNLSVLLLMG